MEEYQEVIDFISNQAQVFLTYAFMAGSTAVNVSYLVHNYIKSQKQENKPEQKPSGLEKDIQNKKFTQ